MLNRHVVPAAALTVVALAGCGNSGTDATDDPTSDPPKRSSRTAVSSGPSTSTQPRPTPTSSGTAPGAPGVPKPARQHTTKGAIAFAKYYTDVLNQSGKSADATPLKVLSLRGCKSCKNYEGNIKFLASHRRHNSGDQIRYHSARRIIGHKGYVINALVDQTRVNVVDIDDRVTKKYPLIENVGMVFYLKWTNDGWRVREIKIDKSRMK